MANAISISSEALDALAAKLDNLDLTDDERAVLNTELLAAAGGDDVTGYRGVIALAPQVSKAFLGAFHPDGGMAEAGVIAIIRPGDEPQSDAGIIVICER